MNNSAWMKVMPRSSEIILSHPWKLKQNLWYRTMLLISFQKQSFGWLLQSMSSSVLEIRSTAPICWNRTLLYVHCNSMNLNQRPCFENVPFIRSRVAIVLLLKRIALFVVMRGRIRWNPYKTTFGTRNLELFEIEILAEHKGGQR